MKKCIVLIVLGIFISYANSSTAALKCNEIEGVGYKIIKEEVEDFAKKQLYIYLNKPIKKEALKKLAFKLKEENKMYGSLYIFYFVNREVLNNGAWATTHFKPVLEFKIFGASEEEYADMHKAKVYGKILKVWFDDDNVFPNKKYLVEENNKLYLKSVYANKAEINDELIKKVNNGVIKYAIKGNDNEYYIEEKNKNLVLYSDGAKLHESKFMK